MNYVAYLSKLKVKTSCEKSMHQNTVYFWSWKWMFSIKLKNEFLYDDFLTSFKNLRSYGFMLKHNIVIGRAVENQSGTRANVISPPSLSEKKLIDFSILKKYGNSFFTINIEIITTVRLMIMHNVSKHEFQDVNLSGRGLGFPKYHHSIKKRKL